jgi:4-hydroxybenzoate polyprenyltransferase
VGDGLLRVAAAGLGAFAGGWIALGRLVAPPLLVWAAVATLGFAAASAALASRPATPTDRGWRPFLVFAGAWLGVASAMLVSGAAVLAGVAAFALLAALPALKRRGPLGNIAAALVTGFPLMYGALAVGQASSGVLPWTLATWIALVRELVADLRAEPEDRARGRRTLPVRMGRSRASAVTVGLALAFVPGSLILPARAGYGGAYFLVALFAQLAVLVVATRLLVGRMDRLTELVNGAMAIGLLALVAGRVA